MRVTLEGTSPSRWASWVREMGPAVRTVAKISARVCSPTSSEKRILDGVITHASEAVNGRERSVDPATNRCPDWRAVRRRVAGEVPAPIVMTASRISVTASTAAADCV
ncbi:hypothetical protein SGLAM104S_02677 [Streptomyces glaucescens]